MDKKQVFSGTAWEEKVGYCRALRVGNQIEVSGTTAVEDRKAVFPEDPYGQARFIFEKIERALQELGAGMEHVVRTRMYVTRIQDWEAVGKAHGEFFGEIQPASTLVEVSSLIGPDLLVEIEATAVVDGTVL